MYDKIIKCKTQKQNFHSVKYSACQYNKMW